MGNATHMNPQTKARILLFAYALSGVAALSYELGWMRELSTMLGSTAYASGTMLAAYMTGLGIGGLLGVWLVKRVKRPMVAASRAELTVAALSIVAFLCIRYMPGYYFDLVRHTYDISAVKFLGTQFVISFIIMVLPTIAMGTTYPLIMKAVGSEEHIGALSGKLYAINTIGGIVGSLLATFAFLPTVGVKGSLIIAAVFSILAAWMIRGLAGKGFHPLAFIKTPDCAIALVVLVCICLIPGRTSSPLGLGQVFYYQSARDFKKTSSERKVLFDKEGIYSRVQVVKNADGSKTLSNGALDEGTNNNYDRVTTTMLAAVPAMSTESSQSALVVGLGTGFTSQMYDKLGFKHVTTVEINPDVLPAAEEFLGKLPTDKDSWNIVVDDARAHILTNNETYDCITSEPSWPWSSGVGALFTQEFMEAAKTRLNDDGVYCQWLPNYLLKEKDLAMMYKTMSQVFSRIDVWSINFPDRDSAEILLIGHKNPQGLTQAETKKRLDNLIATYPFNNEYVVADCITPYPSMKPLKAALKDSSIPLNTDDHSRLEYRVFWNYIENALTPQWGE